MVIGFGTVPIFTQHNTKTAEQKSDLHKEVDVPSGPNSGDSPVTQLDNKNVDDSVTQGGNPEQKPTRNKNSSKDDVTS